MIRVFQHHKHYWLTIPEGEVEAAADAYSMLLGGMLRQQVGEQVSIDLPGYSRLTLDEWEKAPDAPPDDDAVIVEDLVTTLSDKPGDFTLLASPAKHPIGKHAVIADRWGHTITLLQIDWDEFEHLLELSA